MKPKNKNNIKTSQPITWCPGCPNFMILESAKNAISNLINQKFAKQKDFAFVTGIGCHAKIFDYLNLNGVYGIHGRVLPIMQGIKIANPSLKVLGFAGDGDTYAEGIAHFISAFRYNINSTLIVHDNQSFSLTTGQSTPTSQQGFKTKVKPSGENFKPINPVKLALSSGATFIARCNARDIKHTTEILEKAIKHSGFSFVEIIQDCLIFNPDANNKDKLMYKISDCHNLQRAEKFANEFDYNNPQKTTKIPIGVIYQKD